jgi:hypothetical protein
MNVRPADYVCLREVRKHLLAEYTIYYYIGNNWRRGIHPGEHSVYSLAVSNRNICPADNLVCTSSSEQQKCSPAERWVFYSNSEQLKHSPC